MHIVTTHKGTDFDALASVMTANLLYPDVVTVLPRFLNPNVRAFLSLHRDLFGFCAVAHIRLEDVKKLTVVDTNRWDRLERLSALKGDRHLEINDLAVKLEGARKRKDDQAERIRAAEVKSIFRKNEGFF